jgi:hypothetical protein
MDMQTIYALTGIAATVLVGVLAIAITVHYNKRVQITYAHDLSIALTDDITQNFPDLKVLFHNEPVSENLVLIKGYFINTGKKDISYEMIEKPITLTLPAEFEWVECRIVECSPSLRATAKLAGKTEISLETGLWKTREYLKVEALAKVPVIKADPDNLPSEYPAHRLLKALTFPHRIADSKKVRESRVPQSFQRTRDQLVFGLPLALMKSLRFAFILGITTVAFGIIMWAIVHFWPDKTIGYRLTIDGKERLVSVDVRHDKVILQDNEGFKKEYTLSEFDNIPDKHPAFVSGTDQTLAILGLVYIGLGILLLVLLAAKGIRDNRLLALITSEKKT